MNLPSEINVDKKDKQVDAMRKDNKGKDGRPEPEKKGGCSKCIIF